MSDLAIDIQNKIKEAEACGLIYVGMKDNEPQFLGDSKAWKKFDDGDFTVEED